MTAARILLVVPVLGCIALAGLAAADDGAFRFVVREDSLLEWAEVVAYAAAAVVAFAVARRTRGLVRVAYAGLVVAAFAAIGEELSWGQRLFGIATPESVAASNRQHELNLHNVAGAESKTRLVLLVAALYGVLAPLVLRPGPLVPPRRVVPAFAVAAGYIVVRFALLPRPTYAQAKFSEWPELCFAGAVALAALHTLRRVTFDEAAAGRRVHVALSAAPADDVDRFAERDRARVVAGVGEPPDALPAARPGA